MHIYIYLFIYIYTYIYIFTFIHFYISIFIFYTLKPFFHHLLGLVYTTCAGTTVLTGENHGFPQVFPQIIPSGLDFALPPFRPPHGARQSPLLWRAEATASGRAGRRVRRTARGLSGTAL